MTATVGLIGLGNIGMKYDFDKNNSNIKTHAKAFTLNKYFKLQFGVDKNIKNLKLFKSKYKKDTFIETKLALNKFNPDVLVIATPPIKRLDLIKLVVSFYKPKVLLIEKPLCLDSSERKEIIKIINKNEITTFINYHRNSFNTFNQIKFYFNKFKSNGILHYNYGVLNCASHFLILFSMIFGNIKEIELLSSRFKNSTVKYKGDLNINFRVKYQKLTIDFIFNLKKKIYYNFIICNRSFILNYSEKYQNNFFHSHNNINFLKEFEKEIKSPQFYVVENLKNFFMGKPYNLCTLKFENNCFEKLYKLIN